MTANSYLNRVRQLVTSTGTGNGTLGAAYSANAMTLAQAGGVDGVPYPYTITEGNDSEQGVMVCTTVSGITTFTRTVRRSWIAGVSSATAKMALLGNAVLAIDPAAEDYASFATKNDPNTFAAAQTLSVAPIFTDQPGTRAAAYAAPFDALAYNGMQVNGNCEVDQANAGGAVTLTATGSLVSTQIIDGMLAHVRGSYVATAQQVAAPSGMPATKALKITVGTAEASLGANDELSIVLPIEGYRSSRLFMGNAALAAAQSLGFWFQAHRTGTYSGSIRNGGKTRSYPFSFTISAADTPTWVSLAGAAAIAAITDGSTWAADNTVGQYITINLAAGTSRAGTGAAWASADYSGVTGTTNGVAATSDVFYISGIISLPGIELPSSTRAPLIMRLFDQELLLCKRYFNMTYDYGTAFGATNAGGTVGAVSDSTVRIPGAFRFSVEMRAVPTVSIASYVAGTSGVWEAVPTASVTAAASAQQIGTKGWMYLSTSGLTTGGMYYGHYKADARF